MATRRKRALPPWLQGVTVKKQEKRVSEPTGNRETLKNQHGSSSMMNEAHLNVFLK